MQVKLLWHPALNFIFLELKKLHCLWDRLDLGILKFYSFYDFVISFTQCVKDAWKFI